MSGKVSVNKIGHEIVNPGCAKSILNEGHVETASQMADAMHSSGGVPGLCVRLCDRVVSSPVPQIKLDGVSTIANVEYSDTFMRECKAYGMGPGKKITFSSLNLPADLQTASLPPVCSAEVGSAQFFNR